MPASPTKATWDFTNVLFRFLLVRPLPLPRCRAAQYVLNTAILPLLVGMVTSYAVMSNPVDQSWYEAGGVVNQAAVL